MNTFPDTENLSPRTSKKVWYNTQHQYNGILSFLKIPGVSSRYTKLVRERVSQGSPERINFHYCPLVFVFNGAGTADIFYIHLVTGLSLFTVHEKKTIIENRELFSKPKGSGVGSLGVSEAPSNAPEPVT